MFIFALAWKAENIMDHDGEIGKMLRTMVNNSTGRTNQELGSCSITFGSLKLTFGIVPNSSPLFDAFLFHFSLRSFRLPLENQQHLIKNDPTFVVPFATFCSCSFHWEWLVRVLFCSFFRSSLVVKRQPNSSRFPLQNDSHIVEEHFTNILHFWEHSAEKKGNFCSHILPTFWV